MQPVRPAAAGHLASGKFVDDDDFAVLHDVIHVVFVKRVRPQTLINVVNNFHVRGVVQIAEPQQPFAFADAFFSERRSAVLFVERVIDLFDQFRNDFVDLEIFVGRFFRWT